MDDVDVVAEDPGSLRDVGKAVHLQVGREGVRQPHVAWECAQDEVAHLDAVGRDDVAEGVVVVAEELWEVVEQHQQDSQRALCKGHTGHRPFKLFGKQHIAHPV